MAILNSLAPYLLIAACVFFWSLWPLLMYGAFVAVYWAAHTYWQPLIPLTVAEVRGARFERWIIGLGLLALGVVVLWIGPPK